MMGAFRTQLFMVDPPVIVDCAHWQCNLRSVWVCQWVNSFCIVIIKGHLITWTVSIITTSLSVFMTYICYYLHIPIAEKTPGDSSLEHLCGSLSRLAAVEPAILQNWLRHIILGGTLPTPASLPTPTTTLEPASPQQSESSTNAATPTGSASAPPPPPLPAAAAASGKSDTGTQIASSESNSSSHSPTEEHQGLLQENHLLLQGLTAYIVKENR
jgi:hypothetical protein